MRSSHLLPLQHIHHWAIVTKRRRRRVKSSEQSSINELDSINEYVIVQDKNSLVVGFSKYIVHMFQFGKHKKYSLNL